MMKLRKPSARERAQSACVLVLAVHPNRVAATRLRAMQYQPFCRAAGAELVLWSFLREEDLADWFGSSQLRRSIVMLRALMRLPLAIVEIRRADVIIVQREALPLGPPLLEWWGSRRRPLIWDVDDSIWVDFVSPTAGRVPQWLRATGGKYRRICRLAAEVWAGSEVLAGWCRQHQDRVQVVPTVVHVPPQRPVRPRNGCVAWIGSHSTGVFVEQVLPAVAAARHVARVEVVGASPELPQDVEAVVRAWSPEVEAEVLSTARVGLYPVDRDHPLAEGKCGLKAILYMAHGVPAIVTPTTTNALVVRPGVDGLHADSPDEWARAVDLLLEDESLWEEMSTSSYERAKAAYSLQAWGPWVAARLIALTRARGVPRHDEG